MSTVCIIVAAAENNAIGKDNQLLWHLPDDMKFFKQTTSGFTVIMGRKTFESFGKPLRNRRNIVITRQADYHAKGTETVHSLEAALERCSEEDRVFIIGGAEIYRQALPLTDELYLTRVHAAPEGDTYFPEVDLHSWELRWQEAHPADERHAHAFTFFHYYLKRRG